MPARKNGSPAIGELAPGFRLPQLAGGEASLSDLTTAGPVLLAFFKISCPVCQLALPFLERIHAAGGLRIYPVSQNGAKDTRHFNREFGLTMPTLLDPEDAFPASNAYGITHVPTLFLVERDGTVSWTLDGWSKSDIEELARRAGVAVFRQGEFVPAWKAG